MIVPTYRARYRTQAGAWHNIEWAGPATPVAAEKVRARLRAARLEILFNAGAGRVVVQVSK